MKKAVFIKELKYYTPEELKIKLKLSDEEFANLLIKVKSENLIKESNGRLAFDYVGVILSSYCSLMIYPKYLSSPEPYLAFKQVLKVIEKDIGSKSGNFFDIENNSQELSIGVLPIMLWLVDDYYENGLYNVNLKAREENGNGEILWDRTIENDDVLISKNRPYYLTLYTSKKITDTNNIIRLIHKKIIAECFSLLKESMLDAIFDISIEQISTSNISIDESYAISRLKLAMNNEFNSHNRILLANLIYYLQRKISNADYSSLELFGTTAFNMVWQRVLESVLSNVINDQIGSLKLPCKLNNHYDPNTSLLQLISYPIWQINHDNFSTKSTLIPDIISLDANCFYIFDAKYYSPVIDEKIHQIAHQPGIESVTKQYLYEQAYRKFILSQGFKYIVNAFIIPTERNVTLNNGFVSLDFMHSLKLTDIQVIMASANQIYSAYLENQTLKLSEFPVHKSKIIN